MTIKHCRRSWVLFRENWRRSRELWIDCRGMLQQEQNRTVAASVSFGMNLSACSKTRLEETNELSNEVNVISQFMPIIMWKYCVLIVLM
jgi:hypothetical protein